MSAESRYSLALHDLKVSENETAVDKIKFVSESFRVPLTVHLVFDSLLEDNGALYKFIAENRSSGSIEIVFHGLTHSCSKKVYRWLAFYHKYQAEFMVDSESLRENSARMYHRLAKTLGYNPGICPPCWIALRRNLIFFKSLNPPYIETLLHTAEPHNKRFSSVLSLASINKNELRFLKLLAGLIYTLSMALKIKRVRVAVHECDLNQDRSMLFFKQLISSLEKNHYRAALLKELI